MNLALQSSLSQTSLFYWEPLKAPLSFLPPALFRSIFIKNKVLKSLHGWRALKCEFWWGLLSSFVAEDPTMCKILTKKLYHGSLGNNGNFKSIYAKGQNYNLVLLTWHTVSHFQASAHKAPSASPGYILLSFSGWRKPSSGITSFRKSFLTTSLSQLD